MTRYPARFLLALAANPCGCGVGGDAGGDELAHTCRCSAAQQLRYRSRLSGPLLDRVDIQLQIAQPARGLHDGCGPGSTSAAVRERVAAARDRARRRLAGSPWMTSADVPGPVMRRRWPVRSGSLALEEALRLHRISSRGLDRVLRLAWTIAELAGRDHPGSDDVAEALDLRVGAHAAGALSLRQPA